VAKVPVAILKTGDEPFEGIEEIWAESQITMKMVTSTSGSNSGSLY
jgi:hypothetical protein